MRCYFLVYQKDGQMGNDLTDKDPFRWIIDNRKKYENGRLVVLRWLQVDVPQHEYGGLSSQFGIHEEPKEEPKQEESKTVKRPRGWALKKEFIDDNGDIYSMGKLVKKSGE